MNHLATSIARAQVAERVRDFYERYPYPPPTGDLGRYRQLWRDPTRRRAEFHLLWPTRRYREDFSILIAGCGTSQAAKYALRWPESQVIGIDSSPTSIRATEELKRRYSLENLRVQELPLEQASELGMSFDEIVCTGVLNHLGEPDAGLRALRDVLKPGGAMHVMVYAPYGRAGVYLLQEFCRRIGIQATDQDIRELRSALRHLPRGHPLENVLTEARDFDCESAVADALLHPQDRAYTVSEFFTLVESAGLSFGRWLRQAAYLPQCGILAQIPQSTKIADLPHPEQYAAVELFRGTMTRHSAVLYRDHDPDVSVQIDFAREKWLTYVPIRMPETITVRDRLPSGAAAVLINRTHSYTDLFMPISATEQKLFDQIDGHRSIRDIMRQTSGSEPAQTEMLRAFFERLWRHDQVVLDASRER